MGDYADEEVDRGMMSDHPFGRRRYPQSRLTPIRLHGAKVLMKSKRGVLIECAINGKPAETWFPASHVWEDPKGVCVSNWIARQKGVTAKVSLHAKPEPEAIPECVDDNHFTWWYDEYCGNPEKNPGSQYEVAAAAWMEAVKRMSEEGGAR